MFTAPFVRLAIIRGLAVLALLVLAGCGGPATTPTPEATPTMSPLPEIPAAALALTGELTSEWRFAVDPDRRGEQAGWASPGFDDAGWIGVTVPHTWNVMPEYANYDGLAWYRRKFVLPATGAAHLRLRFHAVFYRATVWLNGERLGVHEGGYTPFEFDVSRIARPAAENVIAVQVDNRRAADRIPAILQPNWPFDWWNYGGIVRDAALLITGPVFIPGQQIVAVPQRRGVGQAATAVVTATVVVSNTADVPFEGKVVADVRDDAGRSVLPGTVTVAVRANAGQSVPFQVSATIPSPGCGTSTTPTSIAGLPRSRRLRAPSCTWTR
jgi:beta-glucuronidase